MALYYVEYQNGKGKCAAIMSDKKLSKLKKAPYASIMSETEIKNSSERSFYSSKIKKVIDKYGLGNFSSDNTFGEFGTEYYGYCNVNGIVKEEVENSINTRKEIPITVAGVGGKFAGGELEATRWGYIVNNNVLNAFNKNSSTFFSFNLNNPKQIKTVLGLVYQYRECGILSPDDVNELEERIRTYSNLTVGGSGNSTNAGISEGSKIDTVYRDGLPVKVKRRGRVSIATDAQKRAAENARKFAHTDEANKKRRKSINARRDGKILGEV